MKRLQTWAAVMVMVGGSFGSCETWAQTGNPTAPPPGGPNTPTAPRAPATTQPAARPGTTVSPSRPGTTTRAAAPAAPIRLGQGFDAGSSNPRINQFNQGGVNGGFVPSSAIPGRPNFGGGSTGASLRPVSPIRGGPNPGNPGFIPDAVMDARLFGDSSVRDGALNNFRLPIRAPLAPSAPTFTVAPQIPVAPSTAVVPVVPQTVEAPELPVPGAAQSSAAADVAPNVQATAIEPVFEPQGVATATAYPVRERATAEATATAPQRTTSRSAQADAVEIPSGGGGPRRTGYRGNTQSVDAASGYTLWQGYYWYHSPTAGWHYWDGRRWTRF